MHQEWVARWCWWESHVRCDVRLFAGGEFLRYKGACESVCEKRRKRKEKASGGRTEGYICVGLVGGGGGEEGEGTL